MTSQLNEIERDQSVIKIIQALVKEHSFVRPSSTIRQLYAAEIQDAIHTGIFNKGESSVHPPRKFGNHLSSNPISNSKTNTIDIQVLQNPSRRNPRTFTPLNMSLSEALDQLMATKHLTPLQPTPPPVVLPKSHDPSQFCKFHQGPGHSTDRCLRLRHSIQDLIDTKKIAPPNPKPNVTTNPLPNHDQAFPPPNVNFIEDLPPFDPNMFIIPSTEPKPIVKLPSKLEVCLVRIPGPEFDVDSNDSNIMKKLYHLDELGINDVKF